MDVLFIIPNSSKKAYQGLSEHYAAIEPPTWALLLASALENKDFSCDILDANALRLNSKECVSEIKLRKPKLLCFVLYGQNPNAGTTSMIGAEELAKSIKMDNIDTKICFIGSHVSALPDEVLKNKNIDFVFINEGVYGLMSLLKTNLKDNLDDCFGLGYKKDGVNLFSKKIKIVTSELMDNVLPGYAWELLPFKKNTLDMYRSHYWHTFFKDIDRTPFASIYTSLGCMFSCNFCMINIVNRNSMEKNSDASNYRGMRFWSPEHILNQLDILHNLGVKTLRIADEMFFLNKKYYTPILKGIIERNYNFNLWAYARVDTVREDQLELFKKAGVNWLALGIESGNQEIRQSIDKGRFRDVNVREIVKLIRKYDINVLGNYIFGFPDDNLKSLEDTLNLALELNCEHANFYACYALPGSPLYTSAKKNGYKLPQNYSEYGFYSYDSRPLDTKYLSGSEVLKFRDNAWKKYFTSKKFLNMTEKKFGKENRENVEKLSKISLNRKIY